MSDSGPPWRTSNIFPRSHQSSMSYQRLAPFVVETSSDDDEDDVGRGDVEEKKMNRESEKCAQKTRCCRHRCHHRCRHLPRRHLLKAPSGSRTVGIILRNPGS